MTSLEQIPLIFTVAKRELTSILRGRAEQLLFIWASMFFVPFVTVAILTGFLISRSTEILQPLHVALPASQSAQLHSLAAAFHALPDIDVVVAADPKLLFEEHKVDAYLQFDTSADKLQLWNRDYNVGRQLSHAIDEARVGALKKVVDAQTIGTLVPNGISSISIERYKERMRYMRGVVAAIYLMTYLYAVLWLIPAIDIIRFDFMQNNVYANLCLPISMRTVISGKLVSGVVITLLPTVLSSVAFLISVVAAGVVAFDYFTGGLGFLMFSVPRMDVPWAVFIPFPFIIIAAVAFLHAWLMTVVVFFKGERIAFLLSTTSLFLFAQLSVAYGIFSDPRAVWLDAVPFFGLASLAHQIIEAKAEPLGMVLAFGSTLAAIVGLVLFAARSYRLEPWAQSLNNLVAGRKARVVA